MTATAQSDFVSVVLSPAGVAFAGQSGAVRVSNAHFSYAFTASTPVRVLTSEWSRVLSKKSVNGQPLLQVAGTSNITPQAQLKTLQAQEAVLKTEIATEGKN